MEYQLNPPIKAEEEEWPAHWPDWVTGAFDQLERIERRFPRDVLGGAPKWVDKMSMRIVQMMNPTSQLHPEVSGPALLGSTLGHLKWLTDSEHGLAAMYARLEEVDRRIDKQLQEKLSKEAYEALIDEIDRSDAVKEFDRLSRSFIRLLLRKRRIVDQCISAAAHQDPAEQADFYAAYSKALDKPPMDEAGALTREKFPGTGSIYLLMVLNWKYVVTLRSGDACHAWLCTILGERFVGSTHRIEKMCYNFRINFTQRKRKRRKKKRRNRK
jgi:hypothetical protein